jgi:hypothetical protein
MANSKNFSNLMIFFSKKMNVFLAVVGTIMEKSNDYFATRYCSL